MADKILICWNDTKYINDIKIDGYEKVLFTSKRSLQKDSIAQKADYIVILCELLWSHEVENALYSEMSGIKLAQYLRREEGVKIPILFVSFLSRKNILANHPDAEIISTPALKHGFIQLPSTVEEWIKRLKNLVINKDLKETLENENRNVQYEYSEMSNLDLAYTRRRFCGIIGLLEQINHDISSCGTKEDLDEKLKKMNYANESTNFTFKSDVDELSAIIKNIDTVDYKVIHDKFKRLCDKIISFIKQSEGIKTSKNKTYSILFLEDELGKNTSKQDKRIDSLVKTMESQGFVVTPISRPNYAQKFLSEGKFDAIICDIEIWKEKDDGKELICLGYNYIEHLSKKYRRPIYIILSNVTRSLHSNIINSLGTRVNTYSKSDVLYSDSTKQVFIDGVRNLIEQKKANEEPKNKKNKPKKGVFFELTFRRLRDYIENLSEPITIASINKTYNTSDAVKAHIKKEGEELIRVFEERHKGTIGEKFLFDKINKFKELNKVVENETEDSNIEKFIKVLIARRLLIYVMLKYNYDTKELHKLFVKGGSNIFLQNALLFSTANKKERIWDENKNKLQSDCKDFLTQQEISHIEELMKNEKSE